MKQSPRYWPRDLPRSLCVPKTTIFDNLDLSARRYPDNAAVHYLGTDISYTDLLDSVERFAGWLTRHAGVGRGDRVMLYMQNSPQWLIAYYGILRADAVVIPVNPMNRAPEIRHYLADSGARVAVCAQDLLAHMEAADAGDLAHVVVATYSDYLPREHDYRLPEWVSAARMTGHRHVAWADALAANLRPGPAQAGADDPCGLLYTSGSTGVSKGCLLAHRAIMHNIVGQALWHWIAPGTKVLAVAPMFHIGGLNHGVHMPIYVGGTAVIVPRWDRDLVLPLIERQGVGHSSIPPAALRDLLSAPDLERYDLSSLRRLTSGGAPMPETLAQRLREVLGIEFIEAYGLSETSATTHLNPVIRPKRGSLGVPVFDTESIIVDPETLEPLADGEQGEILVRGPQLFSGYWNRPDATREAFVEVAGKRYLRTGDIGYVDDEGYFFMTDRAKRMINAAGYKVWPAEVELALHQHPAIKEACVISAKDAVRGETVKALVVLRDGQQLDQAALVDWLRPRLAAYKIPRIVQFETSLPKSDIGKILWREAQDAEDRRARGPAQA